MRQAGAGSWGVALSTSRRQGSRPGFRVRRLVSHRCFPAGRRWLVLITCLGVAAALMAEAAFAAADTLQIAVKTATPEQGIPVTVSFAGSAGAIDNDGDGPWLNAVVRPAGGIPCQPSYESDQTAAGSVSDDLFNDDWPEVGPGSFSETTTFDPGSVGSYLVCAWLENESNGVTAGPVAATFAARGPQVSELAVSLGSPALPGVGYQINYTTQTDQQLSLSSIVKPAGGLPCASSYELEQDQNQSEEDIFEGSVNVFGGPETTTATDTEQTAGSYVVCSWIEGPSDGEVDAALSTPIYVGTPPTTTSPAPKPVALTSATELTAFLHWISSGYPSAHGYWACPQAQIFSGQGICLAEVNVGTKRYLFSASAKLSGGKVTLLHKADQAWVRRWSRFSKRVIAGTGAPGTASVNSPYYDWSWLAAGTHAAREDHRSSFSLSAFDGFSKGFGRLFTFRCRASGGMIRCANTLGDAIRYRP